MEFFLGMCKYFQVPKWKACQFWLFLPPMEAPPTNGQGISHGASTYLIEQGMPNQQVGPQLMLSGANGAAFPVPIKSTSLKSLQLLW